MKRWNAALWWACEALAKNPDSKDAKGVFRDAFAMASIPLPAIVGANNRALPRVKELLERRGMSTDEVVFVADAMISVYFADELTRQIAPLLDRYNKDEALRAAANLSKDDLGSVKLMAAGLAGLPTSDAEGDRAWRITVDKSLVEEMTFAFEVDRKALVVVLQASTPKNWPATCESLSNLFLRAAQGKALSNQTVSIYRRRAQEFGPVPEDVGLEDTSFRKCRDGFETVFAKSAAHVKWLLSITREPE